jgi:STE24 endopeptidase
MIQWNFLLLGFLALFFLRTGAQVFLHRLNLSFLRQRGDRIPEVFQGVLDQEKFKKISAYTVESSEFDLLASISDQGFLLVILLSGFLPWLVKGIAQSHLGTVMEGLIFFAALAVLTHLFQIPFDLYDTFVIEERHGFNTMNFRTWTVDLLKSLVLSALLGGLLLAVLLGLVVYGGSLWWFWAWVLLGFFQLLLLWLFPVVIAPLFNKFEPLENKQLEQRIEGLMEKVGLRLRGVFRMDASKRSKHTNAYFTGIGRTKRIVLFDTLLGSHTEDEILAVLAHEIGHWKKKHLLKQLLILETLSLAGLYLVSRLLNWTFIYTTFGFQEAIPYVGFFLIESLASPLGYFVQPLESAISRRFEWEADDYSLRLMGTPEPICGALKRLASDNLSNLLPHPVYAWFYYSHPPLIDRLSRLQEVKTSVLSKVL